MTWEGPCAPIRWEEFAYRGTKAPPTLAGDKIFLAKPALRR